MKLCDLTQFYSPVSGGVKRYVSEKVRFLREHSPGDEHVLIIPGERDACEQSDRARVYTVHSPLLSKTSRYRLLLRLSAVEEILERERPSLIETGDPYQVGWQAVRTGETLRIPVVGFYHSHFPEAYLRPARRFLGARATELLLGASRSYVRALYNRCQRTLVPSPALADLLAGWGVRRVVPTDLGVDHATFHPGVAPEAPALPPGHRRLLYVGRLAQEKNTQTLFAAWRLLAGTRRDLHLLVIGDGLQRAELEQLRREVGGIEWIPYCAEPERLARYYRAADVFVHPGVQETFGLVTLEAQACGTPVVGIRGSYMDRIIHAGLDRWARANTPEALARAIEEAVDRPPELSREALGALIADRYAWREVFQRLFDLYREVVEGSGPLPLPR